MAPQEIEPLTREEARRILEVAATKRNGARWSVALALGIRQGEALGLRWSYVDLETGVIRAWFQVQRNEWRHGCDGPYACGEKWHRQPCRPKCKQHRHLPACVSGCTQKGPRLLQAMERLRAGSSWTDHDLVFATRRGGRIERTEDWRSWKAILVRHRSGMSGCMMPGTRRLRC